MRPHLAIILAVIVCARAATNTTKEAIEDVSQKTNATKEILKASETSDPGKVEIVKQIRRLNDDGSYTVGYEADDGTFKIESRDVLGNVKGTFGYIDKDGEIKRVTYSSSSDSTPVPVSTSTSPTPAVTIKINRTSSSTTRRPQLPTIVYPKGSYTTRGTVIQPIPRRRIIGSSTMRTINSDSTTTENQKVEATTSNILNLYKMKTEEPASKSVRTQMSKPSVSTLRDDYLQKKTNVDSNMKTPHTVKPVYEPLDEKTTEKVVNKANTIRRELTETSPNPHMVSLRQSSGDDSTDVYGSHLSLGTVRPLFTTTTPRPRLVPIHSIVAARQKIQQHYQNNPLVDNEQETTIEASTGRVFDHENVVTSNPVPVIHIPTYTHRDSGDERIYNQPIFRRPPAAVQFRTNEYLRDNPGSPIPIGNQRAFLNYDYQQQPKVLEPQFIKETTSTPQAKEAAPEAATVAPYDIRPVTRIIPIAVDERGVPIPGYQGRFVNPYTQSQQPAPPVVLHPRVHSQVDQGYDDMNAISTPVSTRDLKRLLHILLLRQNKLQALMDQIVAPGPPYQPLFRQEPQQHQYNDYGQRTNQIVYQQRQYPQEEDRYDYRYDQGYRQPSQRQDIYTNQISNYEQPQFDSQRFVRRRLYTRPHYDTAGASSTQMDEGPDFLPAEIREALLLKMLMLAISPDYMPTPVPITEMTTASPARKQVRNVQVLGEEGSIDDMKRKMQRH